MGIGIKVRTTEVETKVVSLCMNARLDTIANMAIDSPLSFNIPDGIDYLSYMPRETLLKRMAKYKKIYAVDRVSLEAQILGCKVISYNGRPAGKVLDNKDAAKILQNKLNKIDAY